MQRSSSSLRGKAAEHKGSRNQNGPQTEEQVPSGAEEDEAGEVGLHGGGSSRPRMERMEKMVRYSWPLIPASARDH